MGPLTVSRLTTNDRRDAWPLRLKRTRAGDVLVVRWIDRLGCNYEDVCDTIRTFTRRGIVVRTVINNFAFDGATKNPMQQAVATH